MNTRRFSNRFHALFKTDAYILLKNDLYNYLLRKRAVAAKMADHCPGWILEAGAGISPVCQPTPKTVFTDVEISGLQTLKNTLAKGNFVVADGTALPFKKGVFSDCISSEVLEHIENDQLALQEMARVLVFGGRSILTFPHRKAYYALDDAYVNHYRRYNLAGISNQLKAAGLSPGPVQKILGPLEKITMMSVIFLIQAAGGKKSGGPFSSGLPVLPGISIFVFKWINRVFAVFAWLDAKITPRSMSSVLLIEATREDKRQG